MNTAIKFLSVLLALCAFCGCNTVNRVYHGMNTQQVRYSEDVLCNIYPILRKEHNKSLIISIGGSGYQSVLGVTSGQRVKSYSTAGMLSRRLSKEYDLLILEKPNLKPFEDGIQKKELLQLYTVDQLSQVYAFAIDTFLSNAAYTNITLFGHSEGGILVPPVYNRLKAKERIARLVIASAGGMSQEKQMLLLSSRNKENPSETQTIQSKFSEIYSDPDSIVKFWWGHPYKRWASFLRYKTDDDIEEIIIPILLYHGKKDRSSPVEASRILFDERNRKRNISLIEDEGDHGSVFWNLRAVENWIKSH